MTKRMQAGHTRLLTHIDLRMIVCMFAAVAIAVDFAFAAAFAFADHIKKCQFYPSPAYMQHP